MPPALHIYGDKSVNVQLIGPPVRRVSSVEAAQQLLVHNAANGSREPIL